MSDHKTSEMIQEERIYRLRMLRATVAKFVGARGKSVQLDGVARSWNMHWWNCGTSACALGSYALTPFGRKFFRVEGQDIKLLDDRDKEDTEAAADHFHISEEEARHLFMPDQYGASDEGDPVPPSKVRDRIDSMICKYERGQDDEQLRDG